MKKIALEKGMDINFREQKVQKRIQELHETKLSTISDENYMKVINLVV